MDTDLIQQTTILDIELTLPYGPTGGQVLSLSPDGQLLAVLDYEYLIVLSTSDWTVRHRLPLVVSGIDYVGEPLSWSDEDTIISVLATKFIWWNLSTYTTNTIELTHEYFDLRLADEFVVARGRSIGEPRSFPIVVCAVDLQYCHESLVSGDHIFLDDSGNLYSCYRGQPGILETWSPTSEVAYAQINMRPIADLECAIEVSHSGEWLITRTTNNVSGQLTIWHMPDFSNTLDLPLDISYKADWLEDTNYFVSFSWRDNTLALYNQWC